MSWIPGTRAWRRRRDVELCVKTAERIQEIVDGELPVESLHRHLDACARCQHEAEAMTELKRAIARVGDEADPEIVGRLQELARRLCERGDC